MSEDTLDDVYRENDLRFMEIDETTQFAICIICRERYNIDEGCCLIDS